MGNWTRQRSRRDVSVSEYKVVNPATNETEREFATATGVRMQVLPGGGDTSGA